MYGSVAGPLTRKLNPSPRYRMLRNRHRFFGWLANRSEGHVPSHRLVNRKEHVMETTSMEIVMDRSMSRRQVVALSGAALAVGAFSAAGGSMPARAQSPVSDHAEGDFSGLVDIGGRSLYLTCAGSG